MKTRYVAVLAQGLPENRDLPIVKYFTIYSIQKFSSCQLNIEFLCMPCDQISTNYIHMFWFMV